MSKLIFKKTGKKERPLVLLESTIRYAPITLASYDGGKKVDHNDEFGQWERVKKELWQK